MLIFSYRYAELEPVHAGGVAIAQFHTAGTHVGNEGAWYGIAVAEGIEYLRTDMDAILVVTLIFIQRE